MKRILLMIFIIFFTFNIDVVKSDVKYLDKSLPLCDGIVDALVLLDEGIMEIKDISFDDAKNWDDCIGALYIENYFLSLAAHSDSSRPHKFNANISVISEFKDGLPNGKAFAIIRKGSLDIRKKAKQEQSKEKETDLSEVGLDEESEFIKLLSTLEIDSDNFIGIYNGNLKDGLPHGKGDLTYKDVGFLGDYSPKLIRGNWKDGCLDWDKEQQFDSYMSSTTVKKKGYRITIIENSGFYDQLLAQMTPNETEPYQTMDEIVGAWGETIAQKCIPGLNRRNW